MRKTYDNEFKVMIVELLNSGRSAKEVNEEYGVESSTIRRWRREFKDNLGDFGKRRELTSEEIELKRLRKELSDVTMERDILKKAVGIFSKSGR
jgi:transposase